MKSHKYIFAFLMILTSFCMETRGRQKPATSVSDDGVKPVPAAEEQRRDDPMEVIQKPSGVGISEGAAARPVAKAVDQDAFGNGVPETPKGTKTAISDWEKTWSVLTSFSTSYDTNLGHDRVAVPAFGFVPSVTAGYQLRSDRQRMKFIYSFAAPAYTVESDLTRRGNFFLASYDVSIGNWRLRSEGEASLKGTNEDRETNNQFLARETLYYRFAKGTRLGVFAAYRLRRYPEEDALRNAVNPMLGIKFSQSVGPRVGFDLGYRFDVNRARGHRSNYLRSRFKAAVDVRASRSDEIEAEISFRPRRYMSRLVRGDSNLLRRDRKWSVDVIWKRELSSGFGFEALYEFKRQFSNDPRKNWRNHQLVFSVTYHWGNGSRLEP